MSKIRLLSETVANQIAAGEVVERPASVAKELLENALDACATRVDISVEQGGRALIQIRDDGEGMSRDDALLAFERHATSKIHSVEDLLAIRTFGFRGEALASIASVSRITLLTKLHSDVVGTEVEIQGGKIQRVRDAAWPGGTEITLRDLFFNVPARRKFLKSEATESFHIANLVTHYALANPARSFSLHHNGRETLSVSSATNLRERAYQLFGERFLDEMTEIQYEKDGIVVWGFASHPHIQRTSRDGQYLFVNGRFVKDKLLGRAISQAYRSLLPSGTYPSVTLFLALPSEDVDVNVHPQKTEVRFRLQRVVQECVVESVRLALSETRPFAPFPSSVFEKNNIDAEIRVRMLQRNAVDGLEITKNGVAEHFAEPRLNRNFKSDAIFDGSVNGLSGSVSGNPSELSQTTLLETQNPSQERGALFSCGIAQKVAPSVAMDEGLKATSSHLNISASQRLASLLGKPARCGSRLCAGAHRATIAGGQQIPPLLRQEIRILGQIHHSYIVAADTQGLLLVDQHVAHERILFERQLRLFEERTLTSQRLLIPEMFELTPAQSEVFGRICHELEANGFDCRLVGQRTLAIQAVPADIDINEARTLLIEVLDIFESEEEVASMENYRRELAASLACRAAVKINMTLTVEKMEWLMDELFKTENPTNCPHGRPVILRFSLTDIERGFHRI